MDEEILYTIKGLLGTDNWEAFDTQILGYINDTLLSLDQLGCLKEYYDVLDEDTTWEQIIKIPSGKDQVPASVIGAIKVLVYIRVKLLFDPPQNTQYYEKRDAELQWRIKEAYEPYTYQDINEIYKDGAYLDD